MFYPFNQHKQKRPKPTSDSHTDRLAKAIASRWLKWQRRFSDAVNARIAKLSSGSQKFLFYILIASAGLCSTYLIISGFSPDFSARLFSLPFRHVPPLLHVHDKYMVNDMQSFQLYLDSLENAFILDSIQQSKTNPKP